MINRRLKLIINKGGVNMGLFSELFSNIVSDILINSYISAINYEEDENSFDENNINEDFGLSEEDTKYFQQRMLKGMENIRKTQEMRRDRAQADRGHQGLQGRAEGGLTLAVLAAKQVLSSFLL